MATSHKNIPMPCWSFQPPHPRLACVATTLWSALQSWCSQKKIFPFVPGYFLGRSDASARSQHGPTNGCFTRREGERREQPGQAGGGNCLGSWHCKETNLELWVDQSLLTFHPSFPHCLHGASGSALTHSTPWPVTWKSKAILVPGKSLQIFSLFLSPLSQTVGTSFTMSTATHHLLFPLITVFFYLQMAALGILWFITIT